MVEYIKEVDELVFERVYINMMSPYELSNPNVAPILFTRKLGEDGFDKVAYWRKKKV